MFGVDGFNVFNYVRFGMAANYNNITNAAFGKVGSQNNLRAYSSLSSESTTDS